MLLGVLVPGLGQAYGGDPRRACLWFLGAVALGTVTIRAMLTGRRPPFNLVLPLCLLFVYYIAEIVDAARVTSRNRTMAPRPYDRWWVWAGIVALFLLVVQPGVTSVFRRSGEGVVLFEDSMAPTLLKYDCVMVHKAVTTRQRGEVVAFESGVVGVRKPIIARVIGLPGDRVAVRDGVMMVNDEMLAEPYVGREGPVPADFGPVAVPPRRLFLLGDNRNITSDSRAWGFLPEQDVIGRVNLIYFSQDPVTRAIRWERIGHPVR